MIRCNCATCNRMTEHRTINGQETMPGQEVDVQCTTRGCGTVRKFTSSKLPQRATETTGDSRSAQEGLMTQGDRPLGA